MRGVVAGSRSRSSSSSSSRRLIANVNQLRRHGNVRRRSSCAGRVRNYYGRDLRLRRIIRRPHKRRTAAGRRVLL